ncbi:MAG: sulfate adenylyltransferase subunit CysN [Methylobacterium mesophilicum]|nr:sulfate adenylyltransferase subunit CysN [Methylobacterium mesophilicum]
MNKPLAPDDFEQYLDRHENKDLLRFLTCGSVDDGKSTLIGRLLFDTKLLFADQLASLERDSRKHGTVGEDIDLALLVDGLEAEREQGITIDVAYRFFATEKRKFIVADTPGHEQYTRNMATGASNADLAVILIDARKGVLTQTRRHSFIVSLLGIRQVVLAVNKIDLVDYSQAVFDRIVADYKAFAADLGFERITPIPLSARYGDNVFSRSENLSWHDGPTLIEELETVDVSRDLDEKPFRMPVQWVNRPNLDFRGFSGTIASGTVEVGDRIAVAASGRISAVRSIVAMGEDGKRRALAGEAVTLTLDDEVDVSRGDVLCAAEDRPEVSDQFSAHLIWMHEEPLALGRTYLLKLGTRTVRASISEIRHAVDVNDLSRKPAEELKLNEVALVHVSAQEPLAFDPYAENRAGGGFILIDRLSNLTIGAGTIEANLRRASNVHWQALDISKDARANLKGQKPAVLWFTGLSGAGKSTIANLVEKRLHSLGRHTYLLDGDNIRHGLNKDLGFSDADRAENIRRVAETAKLMADAGLIVLASFISPFRAERDLARSLFEPSEFMEIFVDTPLDLAEKRDPKGLYKKARDGEIPNFTGISSPYEPPEKPEFVLNTANLSAEENAERLVSWLRAGGYLAGNEDWVI